MSRSHTSLNYPLHKFVVVNGKAKVSPLMRSRTDEQKVHHIVLVEDVEPESEPIDWDQSSTGWILGEGAERTIVFSEGATPGRKRAARKALVGWCRRHGVRQLRVGSTPFRATTSPSELPMGENIRRLLGLHELSLAEAARLFALSPQAVSLLVNEKRDTSPASLERIAEVFEVSAERLREATFVELLGAELSDRERFLRVEERIAAERRKSGDSPRTRRKGPKASAQ